MVRLATHTRFASQAQSHRTPPASRSHRGGPLGVHLAAAAQGAATPHPSCRWPRPRSARRCVVAQASLVAASDTSLPRPDASPSSSTSAAALGHCAQPPRPPARTDAVSLHNLTGPQIAAGFEARQAARSALILAPLFWRHLGTTLFAYHAQKGACPHRQGRVAIPARKRAHFVVLQASSPLAH